MTFSVPAGSTADPATGAYAGTGFGVDDSSPNARGAIWGRWFSGSVTDASGTITISGNAFHYLIGPNTPPEVIAAKTGAMGFDLVPNTLNMSNNLSESAASLTPTRFSVDFTNRNVILPTTNITFTSQNWTLAGASVPLVIQPGKGAFFQSTAGASCGPTTGCTGTGQVSRTGVFMGPAGDHIGMSFQGRVTGQNPATFNGTAIFTCAQTPC